MAELDRPIQEKDQDRLGRGPFVEQLTDALVDKNTRRSSGLVVSLLGAWGSGKSSILNLLETDLKDRYESAIVLRFDPWLIANRDSLVRQFLSDLGKILAKDHGISANASKQVGKLLSDYDDVINVGIEAAGLLPIPLLPYVLKAGKNALKKTDKTLHELKEAITKEIEQISYPIVVLIDEVDRLEDSEVLEIMRLVKAVADFPNVSYLIAYDVDRVVEALGASARNTEDASHRGRAYLEKIVQHQVFLPALFETELIEMFRKEIKTVVSEAQFPNSRYSDDRYSKLENAIFPSLIRTPRDLKRCIGVFRTLYLMVEGEVNWIDLLGYATLLEVLGENYLRKRPEAKLLQLLFPRFSEKDRPDDDHTRIEHYRALCFLIRQGTPPGSLPLRIVREVFELNSKELVGYFSDSVRTGQFDDLNYILSYHYSSFNDRDHVKFWTAFADWCRKPDRSVPTSQDPRVGYIEVVESSFRSALGKSPQLSSAALQIISAAANSGAVEFAARILRDQIWAHGLFGHERRHDFDKIGKASDWERFSKDFGALWKQEHLNSDWFFGSWKESPVWLLRDIGVWDGACTQRLDQLTEDEPAFEAFVMMVFGRHYRIDRSGVETLIGWENFARKFKRLQEVRTSRPLSNDIQDAIKNAEEAVMARDAQKTDDRPSGTDQIA
ncbi:MAG: hypothetical protein EOS65_31865 [Mesorhizobium sp.]|uniref:KAP family P-loop NTPase fold protein n=1 Tax=Mesorhizobium sp. TaxID=1871066 RepID=UPI000FD46A21|nr:P-loop NTPase fold protein [Mesorhizobium sp.]RVC63026.1 hypothetical protein EN779_06105 [Mesorhizobium sp. M4B.F.Ca.ET.088.02.2.1]RWF28895.1 MAG: hypothetical protein EOS45_20690 [Mesorhizobium sp.]RWF32721.1 MAG: hypothetical protein EOS65_31865 [Mesorhizobium sp.]TIX18814.1 MAG: hypothetical protein E5V41_04300 [Mesorhizobium sp.]TJW01703.1 MAG: hypothetical protein E5W97_26155 [Mesorhizobium sp.]